MKTNAEGGAEQSPQKKSVAKKSAPIKKKGAKKKIGSKKGAGNLFSASDNIQTIDRDTVMINGITIDIEKITDEQLYYLRKILPRKDYR